VQYTHRFDLCQREGFRPGMQLTLKLCAIHDAQYALEQGARREAERDEIRAVK